MIKLLLDTYVWSEAIRRKNNSIHKNNSLMMKLIKAFLI